MYGVVSCVWLCAIIYWIAIVDESVELVKVHEGGAVELVMKYGDIYELTIQSIKEVQEAM